MNKFRYALLMLTGLCATAADADEPVAMITVAVTDGIHMLMGKGGNIAVSTGRDGTFIVDDQYAIQHGPLLEAVKALSDDPVKLVVNTHWHTDHTGGNARFGEAATIIIAHDNVRKRLSTDQVIEFFNSPRPAAPATALPVVTFSRDVTLHLNDDDVHIFHVRAAHTDGDAVVHFQRANVIHTGDVFFNERYPFIDSGGGGTIAGMIEAVERILALADDDTRIIPGHGSLTDKTGLTRYLEMLRAAQNAIAALIVAGNTMEQAVLAKPLASYDAKWGAGFIAPDVFIKMLYDNLRRTTLKQ